MLIIRTISVIRTHDQTSVAKEGPCTKVIKGISPKLIGVAMRAASSASDCSAKFRWTDDALEGLASGTMTDRRFCKVCNC